MQAKPNRSAVALAYKAGHAAPHVVAKGRGLLAETIIEKAKEAGLTEKLGAGTAAENSNSAATKANARSAL